MSRAFLCRILSSAFLLFAANSMAQLDVSTGATAKLQVLYVVGNTNIATYNVDPQTFNLTQVGDLAVNNPTYYYNLAPSPNGRFVYFVADDAQYRRHLWVYATNSLGAPQTPAVQTMMMPGLFSLEFDLRGNFAYAVKWVRTGKLNDVYFTIRYQVSAVTGQLTAPAIQARYELPSGAGGSEFCGPALDGFNKAGTKMYDEVNCSNHEGDGTVYYERSVDTQTGALGPDVQIYGWANDSGGGERIQFVGDLMFDFVLPNDYQQNVSFVDIYPLVPNTTGPVLQCTAQMLASCGFGSFPGVAHPSGKYIFLPTMSGGTEVDRVELARREIVASDNAIPYGIRQFSPDGAVAYAEQESWSGYTVEVYGFNVARGTLTVGGSVGPLTYSQSYFIAERR